MHSSLAHGLAILDLLVEEGRPIGLADIARRLDLSKSGAHGLLATLVSCGYVERAPRGVYRLGNKAWLTRDALPTVKLIEAAGPVMRGLVERIKDGAILGVLSGFEVVYVHLEYGSQAVRVHAEVGDRVEAHCASTGLALLAFQDEATLDRMMPSSLRAYTPETITDPAMLRAELARIKARGYSINHGGWNSDVGGIAAPILPATGAVAFGLCVAVPRYRMTRDWIRRTAPALLDATGQIAAALGAGRGMALAS